MPQKNKPYALSITSPITQTDNLYNVLGVEGQQDVEEEQKLSEELEEIERKRDNAPDWIFFSSTITPPPFLFRAVRMCDAARVDPPPRCRFTITTNCNHSGTSR